MRCVPLRGNLISFEARDSAFFYLYLRRLPAVRSLPNRDYNRDYN